MSVKSKWIMISACFAVLLCVLLAAGCFQGNGTGLPPSENPKDYFPMNPETEWHYKITAGNTDALTYETVSWPISEKQLSYATRGWIYSAKPGKTYDLIIKVEKPQTEQGPLKVSDGVELKIIKDDLDLFKKSDSTGIFWAPFGSDGGTYMINQVITYSPNSMGAPSGPWGSWGQKDGYSLRLLFFADKPGIEISRSGDPDALLFEGVDNSLPGYSNCLKFTRTVKESEPTSREATSLDKSFTETTWFAKDKGLVRLEQKVNGQTSMTWTLEKFTKG
jgi:hypothetical protein